MVDKAKEFSQHMTDIKRVMQNAQEGKPLWQGAKGLFDTLKVGIADWLANLTGPAAGRFGTKLASRFTTNKERAGNLGRGFETGYRMFIPTFISSFGAFRTIYRDTRSYLKMNHNFQPALALHTNKNVKPSSFYKSDLEVVRNARSLSASKIKHSSTGALVNVVAMMPLNAMNYLKQMVSNDRARGEHAEKYDEELGKLSTYEQGRIKAARKWNAKLEKWFDKLNPDNMKGMHVGLANAASHLATGEDLKYYHEKDRYSGRRKRDHIDFINDVTRGNVANSLSLLSGGIATTLNSLIGRKSREAYEKPTAAKMIFALEAEFAKNPSLSSVSGLIGQPEGSDRIEDYIEAIFRQHHLDCGRGEIPRSVEDQLKEAAKEIAEAMTDPHRKLHPQTLAIMVDRKHGIMKYEGQAISGFEAYEDLIQRIQTYCIRGNKIAGHGRHSKKQYFNDVVFTEEELMECWQGLTDEEKFIWSSFLPDIALKSIGVANEEIAALRAEGNEYWAEVVESTLEAIQDLSPSDLRDMGFTQQEANEISELIAWQMQGKREEIVKHRHRAMDYTSQLGVLMEQERPGFLSEILEQAVEKREKKVEFKRKKSEESFADKYGGSAKSDERQTDRSSGSASSSRRSSRKGQESSSQRGY
jgi:hypothetical protein